jgi:alpha-mannosidase
MLGSVAIFAALAAPCAAAPPEPPLILPKAVYIVPNFHPASCGWLANWSVERNYCANSYLDHLDRVRDDPNYAFAISECNNMIAILNFYPERFEELKGRIKEGRVEAVNAFFLEPTINLSGGEALVKMGVEGLRWQQQVLGVRPRFVWAIDVCGMHEQMAQITAGLGLEALVYCRMNRTGSTIHWAESPDGTRALALSPGHYLEWRPLFQAKEPLAAAQVKALARDVQARMAPLADAPPRPDAGDLKGAARYTPQGAPVLILAGSGDYSLAPLYKGYPAEFIKQFKEIAPATEVKFTTPGKYLDAILPAVRSGELKIPTMKGGTEYTYGSFWIQNPRVKTSYRLCEQRLQAAEMLATAASLKGRYEYPVQDFYHAWLLMCLNMDRNTLWGAAGGMVFECDESWDANDRFEWVDDRVGEAPNRVSPAADSLGEVDATAVTLFNPLNWAHRGPVILFSCGAGVEGLASQLNFRGAKLRPGDAIIEPPMLAAGIRRADFSGNSAARSEEIALPKSIETDFYSAGIDPATGALVSLKLKPSGREMLGGPANVLVAERTRKQQGNPGDHTPPRDGRERLATSSEFKPDIKAYTGPLATIVEVVGMFYGGGPCTRIMRFYKDYPRIDFETHLEDIPDRTVVVAEFPLAEDITEVRRGIPYGFSHGAWSKPNPELHGWTKGITPAVRWSHYTLSGGGGVALLDKGLSGRELTEKTPIIFLLNATEKYYAYPNAWLSGKGEHDFEYALVAHDGEWRKARIPQMAWEFNCPPLVLCGKAPAAPQSFLQTSDNVIVEALRREGPDIELRMAECFGYAGEAEVTLNLPHTDARLTDLVGGNAKPLAGGPTYKFPIRPQQIVTMRFRAPSAVPDIKPLTKWDDLVPVAKREALNTCIDAKGHPPRGQ